MVNLTLSPIEMMFHFQNSDKYVVPENHYFFLGDNRDCSKDSRFLSEVGYVHHDNLVGKAQILFFHQIVERKYILKFGNGQILSDLTDF